VTSEGVVTAEAPDANRRRDAAQLAAYALAAFLSLLGAIRYGVHAETVVVVFVITVLVVISRHDLERHIIPNRIVVPAWIAVLLAHLAIHPDHWLEWIGGSIGAGAFFLLVLLAYPAGLGMGDVKLVLLIGAALGSSVIAALLLGTFAAGVVAAGMLFAHGSAARKRAIPLGPFLAAGAIVTILFL
jgi:leader peptidase (prepilin peptidase)/N-methyltransferase